MNDAKEILCPSCSSEVTIYRAGWRLLARCGHCSLSAWVSRMRLRISKYSEEDLIMYALAQTIFRWEAKERKSV